MTEIEELQQERADHLATIADLTAMIEGGNNSPALRMARLLLQRRVAQIEARLRELGVEV